MKYSKQLPLWKRNKSWAIYIKMPSVMRKQYGIRNFESFCKKEMTSEIWQLTLDFVKHRPKLKINQTKLQKMIQEQEVKPMSNEDWKKSRMNAYNPIKQLYLNRNSYN